MHGIYRHRSAACRVAPHPSSHDGATTPRFAHRISLIRREVTTDGAIIEKVVQRETQPASVGERLNSTFNRAECTDQPSSLLDRDARSHGCNFTASFKLDRSDFAVEHSNDVFSGASDRGPIGDGLALFQRLADDGIGSADSFYHSGISCFTADRDDGTTGRQLIDSPSNGYAFPH